MLSLCKDDLRNQKYERVQAVAVTDAERARRLDDARTKSAVHRQELRDMFNIQELRLDELFTLYDVDSDGRLCNPELNALLAEFNNGKEPSADELDWIKSLADKDEDSLISRSEFLVALRAWIGYVHMEDNLHDLFKNSDLDCNGYLDLDELRNVLTQINGTEVSKHEAEEVMDIADKLKDNKLGRYEFMGAIAAWYISVGREPTPAMSLAFAANNNSGGKYTKIFHYGVALMCGPCAYFPLQAGFGTSSECVMDIRDVLLADGFLWLTFSLIVLLKTHWVQIFHFFLGRRDAWKLMYKMSWVVIGIEVFTVTLLFVVEALGIWCVCTEKSFPEEEVKTCEAGARLPISFHDSIAARDWRTYRSLLEFSNFWFIFNFWFNFATLVLYYAHIINRYLRAREADLLMQGRIKITAI